jgi:hypothetical protein
VVEAGESALALGVGVVGVRGRAGVVAGELAAVAVLHAGPVVAARVGAHLVDLEPVTPGGAAHDGGVARLGAVGLAAVGVEQLAQPLGALRGRVVGGAHSRPLGLGALDRGGVGVVAS